MSKGNVPNAPPIHWFYSWIKKEPFGDNVAAPTAKPAAPVEKVYANDDDDLSLDLSMIDDMKAAGQGDPGDIFNEGPPA